MVCLLKAMPISFPTFPSPFYLGACIVVPCSRIVRSECDEFAGSYIRPITSPPALRSQIVFGTRMWQSKIRGREIRNQGISDGVKVDLCQGRSACGS